MAAPRVCMVSTVSSHGAGGLSAYVRHLRRALEPGWHVSEAARFFAEGPGRVDHAMRESGAEVGKSQSDSVSVVTPSGLASLALGRVHHLVNRPALARLGVATFSTAYRTSLAAAMPRDTEVVHSVGAGWELLGFPALEEARRRGAAFAVTPAIHPGNWGDSALDARLYRAADAVFALSAFESERLARLGVAPGRIHVTPLAPALEAVGDAVRFRREHGLDGRQLVLFVGRKQRYKGYHALCEAMESVVEMAPDACLVSVGQDTEPPYPAIPNGAHVDLGACGEQEKADALAACDVFCMPSHGESLGIVYLEAWAHGKPVVAGMAPAVAELVRDGENGFRVPGDPHAISAVLVRLLLDPGMSERLGRAGRELQAARYTWEAAAEVHASVFGDIAGRKSPNPPSVP